MIFKAIGVLAAISIASGVALMAVPEPPPPAPIVVPDETPHVILVPATPEPTVEPSPSPTVEPLVDIEITVEATPLPIIPVPTLPPLPLPTPCDPPGEGKGWDTGHQTGWAAQGRECAGKP